MKINIEWFDFYCALEASVTNDSYVKLLINRYFISSRFEEGAPHITTLDVVEARHGSSVKVIDILNAINSLPIIPGAGTYLEGINKDANGNYSFRWGT